MSLQKGRQGAPSDLGFTNTIAPKSAEQGMLLKLDVIMDALAAVRDGADLAAIQTALDALDLDKIDLK